MADEDKPIPPAEPDKDKDNTPPEPDRSPAKEPINSESEKDKADDKAQNYDELRRTYTQTAMERAKLAKENEELRRKVAEKEKPPEDKPNKPTLQQRLEKVRTLKQRAIDEGIDPTLYEEQEDDLLDRMTREQNQKFLDEVTQDFNEFIGNEKFAKEIDGGLYTVKDLMTIQHEMGKKGRNYDLRACRDRFVEDNQEKVETFRKKIKTSAGNASSLDGEPKDAPKSTDSQDKLRSALGLY